MELCFFLEAIGNERNERNEILINYFAFHFNTFYLIFPLFLLFSFSFLIVARDQLWEKY